MKILTNDPSFTAWGYAVLDEQGNVHETGCIKTVPEQKKRRIRKSDDTVRRIQEINKTLILLIDKYNIDYILSEAPHGSQNASAAVMIGVVTGIVQTLADCFEIPIDWYSENDAKKHLLGKISATKTEIIKNIGNLYNITWTGIKYKDEAVADAMAIFNVARTQSELLKYMKRKTIRTK